MKSLKQLLGLCEHKFKKIGEAEIQNSTTGSVIGHIFILQCEKCGKIKTKRI